MSNKAAIRLEHLKKVFDNGARHSNPNQQKRRLPHGFLDNDLDMARAFAMVKVALEQNEAVRPLWVDIRCAWGKPGCADFITSYFENDNALNQLFSGKEQTLRAQVDVFVACLVDKNDPDIVNLFEQNGKFIIKAFNGPIDPMLQNRWGTSKDIPVPKYGIRVTAESAPVLKTALLILSWLEYKGIDIESVDREHMGANYEPVTSGEKPSTDEGRKRKSKINEFIRMLGLHYMNEATIREGAIKWYQARVIRGSIVEAASDYDIGNPSTFSRMIEDFDRVAGRR